ncbi:hypothetical protein [Haloarchaeobius amylolyticus]|uniref:hypothetical protein n=1 Tax=Haloarchaeobius amylolyticus TaxID=1198296 RepID=UPI00226F586C|nr:hypothetical protein [Haloarchaeobius amylolyticus]
MRRRALLSGLTAAATVGLAGCSAMDDDDDDPATLDRMLLRSDTGEPELLSLTLVYAPRDGSNERPIWGTFEAPAADEPRAVTDFEGDPGFYSLTAVSDRHHTHEVVSFNSHGAAVGAGPLQFEVVVQESGDLWANLGEAGDEVSIPA